MIPPTISRTVGIGGAQASAKYKISDTNAPVIMGILRDGLYTDRELAVLREYGSNAYDAHCAAGKRETPIKVTLPTSGEPTVRIRDYGLGLSHDDVFTVYTQYGDSTKRNDNDSVGMLGIGSKSGFCYADSFTIVSWHGGWRRTYVAMLDESDEGAIHLLDEQELLGPLFDHAEAGVEIQIIAKPEDHGTFMRTARRLFKHMRPRPDINCELPELSNEMTVLDHGVIIPGGEVGWVAVMGCIPYRVNLDQLDSRSLGKAVRHLSGELTFPIGSMQFSSSREELRYTTQTKAALVAKFDALVDEYVIAAFKQLDDGTLSDWEARLRVRVLDRLELPLPEKWKGFAESFAKVEYTHDQLVILHNKTACTRLTVTDETTLLIDDEPTQGLSGYEFDHNDYVVRAEGKTAAEIRTTLDAVIKAAGLTGVKIGLLSHRYWRRPIVKAKRTSNPKHRARMFRLEDRSQFKAPWSEAWTAQTRTPTDDDVFVVIDGFKAQCYARFFENVADDRRIAGALGVQLPPIYGYKTTARKPMVDANCKGTHYREWRQNVLLPSLITPELIAKIQQQFFALPYGDWSWHGPNAVDVKNLTTELGPQHPITALARDAVEVKAVPALERDAVASVAARMDPALKPADPTREIVGQLDVQYPLLQQHGFYRLWRGRGLDTAAWLDYVKLIDERAARARVSNLVTLVSIP